ncbi:MAG: sugar nucleotide-binding protein [Pseudomonadota bacterium]
MNGCNFDGRRAFVVGGDSGVGSALAPALRGLGAQVMTTTRRKDVHSDNSFFVDLAQEPKSWELPESVDVSYLCAAITSIAQCEDDSPGTARINVDQTLTLAQSLIERGSKIVFISTSLVFAGDVPRVGADAQVVPQCEYGHQKARVEAALLNGDGSVAILRPSKILTDDFPLLVGWRDQLENGETISPFADLIMSPVSIRMVLGILCQIGASNAQGIYQISADQDVSYAEVATHISNLIGCDSALVKPTDSRSAGVKLFAAPSHTTLDSSRVEEELKIPIPSPWVAVEELIAGSTT